MRDARIDKSNLYIALYLRGTSEELRDCTLRGKRTLNPFNIGSATEHLRSSSFVNCILSNWLLLSLGIFPLSVHARNDISSADAFAMVKILNPVSIAWVTQPPEEVYVNRQWNASVLVDGTNVTVIINFGDGTEPKEAFFKSDQHNKVMNFLHKWVSPTLFFVLFATKLKTPFFYVHLSSRCLRRWRVKRRFDNLSRLMRSWNCHLTQDKWKKKKTKAKVFHCDSVIKIALY